MSIESYFSGWKERTWTCLRCEWSGPGAHTGSELFAELFEVNCPACDARLGTIPLPTHEQIREAAEAGNAEALEMMGAVSRAEDLARELQSSRQTLKRLKIIDGENLEFTLSTVDTEDWMSPSHVVLSCNGKRIYKERSGYEHWEAVIEIGQALLAQYGDRMAWYDPGQAGIALLGDNLSASYKIREVLNVHNIAPPKGPWSQTKEKNDE